MKLYFVGAVVVIIIAMSLFVASRFSNDGSQIIYQTTGLRSYDLGGVGILKNANGVPYLFKGFLESWNVDGNGDIVVKASSGSGQTFEGVVKLNPNLGFQTLLFDEQLTRLLNSPYEMTKMGKMSDLSRSQLVGILKTGRFMAFGYALQLINNTNVNIIMENDRPVIRTCYIRSYGKLL